MADRTQGQIRTDINNKLANNSAGDISAQDVREVLIDLNDSKIDSVPDASETQKGVVEGADATQAAANTGTVFLAWKLDQLKSIINAIVPAVFRTGNTTRIPISKLATGTPDGTKYIRDDGALVTPSGSGGQGPPGPEGSLGLTDVGGRVSVDGAAVAGPALTDLATLIRLDITYTRTSVSDLHMQHVMRKSEITSTEYKLQLRGGGAAFVGITDNSGVMQFSNASATGYSNISIQVQNIGASEGEDGPEGPEGPPGRDTGYVFYSRPTLAPVNVAASQDLSGGATWSQTILDAEDIPGRIYTDWDFITDWAGTISLTPGKNGALSVMMKTTHVFNSKTLVVATEKIWPVRRDNVTSIPFDLFDSFARVALGAFTDSDGTDVTIEAADLDGPTTISLEIIVGYHTEIGNAGALTIQDIVWDKPAVRFFQIPHGAGGFTPPLSPSVSSFEVTSGDTDPVAGSIAGGAYSVDWSIAQSGHAGAARIVGFKGDIPDAGGTLIYTLPSGTFAHGSHNLAIPAGISLAATETYTLRLEVFDSGVTNPAADQAPVSYHDIVITAHAAAGANVHWGRVQRTANEAEADTVARIDFDADDTTTGSVLDTAYTSVIPNDGNQYQLYLAVLASLTQPTGFTLGGQPASAGFSAAIDKVVSGATYKVYLQNEALAQDNAGGDGLRYGITTG